MSFDTLAPHYRWMEFLLAGEKLQRARTAFLKRIPPPANILLLGEGNGRFLPACRAQFPGARITCVDASAAMIGQARRRLLAGGIAGGEVSFVQTDALAWLPVAGAYDLIVTNFFLDCFRPEQLERLINTISVASSKQATWLVADFQVASAGLRRLRSEIILRLMYAFFRVVTRLPARQLVRPDPFLQRAGFALQERRQFEWGLLHSDWWQKPIVE